MNASVERGRVSAIGCFIIAFALHAIDAPDVAHAQQPQQSSPIQIYPEYRKKLRERYTPPAACTRYCCGWGGGNPAASGLKCIVGGQ